MKKLLVSSLVNTQFHGSCHCVSPNEEANLYLNRLTNTLLSDGLSSYSTLCPSLFRFFFRRAHCIIGCNVFYTLIQCNITYLREEE